MIAPRPAAVMPVPFVKASACGNDFLIIAESFFPPNPSEFCRQICDRRHGVGADGVEWVFPTPHADVQARLFNADGSQAEVSGNGTRCVAAHWMLEHASSNPHLETVAVLTDAGKKTCRLISRHSMEYEFETDMGLPLVTKELSLKVGSVSVKVTPVSMGNPHCVIFSGDHEMSPPEWLELAGQISGHPQFPQGTNVELVKVEDRNTIHLQVFERGVGETQSSGTGSCAAAVAAISSGRTDAVTVVRSIGGRQEVHWDGQSNVFLSGPAGIVCRGEFFG